MQRPAETFVVAVIAVLALSTIGNAEYVEDDPPCTCVPISRCREEVSVVDLRSTGACAHYLFTCCVNVKPNVTSRRLNPPLRSLLLRGCGQRNTNGAASWRLRNGSALDGETQYSEWPWMVAVMTLEETFENEQKKDFVYQCGGSLIHPKVVLTAAHCVASYVKTPRQLKVLLGDWDMQTAHEELPVQSKTVAAVILHGQFEAGALLNDVALLVLHGPARIADNVNVVCLPGASRGPRVGQRCTTTGWGKDKLDSSAQYQRILKSIELPLVSRQGCQTALRSTRLSKYFMLHESFTCAGGEENIDSCAGDGGGPLMCPVPSPEAGLPDHYEQVGVVSWGIGCGKEGVPAVYVDVAHVRPWIDATMVAQNFTTDSYTWPKDDDDVTLGHNPAPQITPPR